MLFLEFFKSFGNLLLQRIIVHAFILNLSVDLKKLSCHSNIKTSPETGGKPQLRVVFLSTKSIYYLKVCQINFVLRIVCFMYFVSVQSYFQPAEQAIDKQKWNGWQAQWKGK